MSFSHSFYSYIHLESLPKASQLYFVITSINAPQPDNSCFSNNFHKTIISTVTMYSYKYVQYDNPYPFVFTKHPSISFDICYFVFNHKIIYTYLIKNKYLLHCLEWISSKYVYIFQLTISTCWMLCWLVYFNNHHHLPLSSVIFNKKKINK